MARKFQVSLVGNLSEAIKFKKYTRSKAKQQGFETAARRFQKYLRNRFIALAAGGGEWAPLAESTIAQKESLKSTGRITGNPKWILRRQNILVNSIEYKLTDEGFEVGYITKRRYPKMYKKDRARTIRYVAQQHQVGNGRVPKREIIVTPPGPVIKEAIEDIRKSLIKYIKSADPKGFRRV